MASKSDKYSEYKKILYGENTADKAKKSLNNYKARLASSNIDVDNALDTRNPIERALNLEKDQNFIFDLFELINRPQQALFNAWEAGQEGKDVGKAAWEGFSGQRDTQFKNILKNYGMEDREGKIDLSDVLGFAGDVFLDPMDIVPVAGFSKFGDALEAGASVGQAAKNLRSGTDLVMSGIGKGLKGTAKLADKGIEKALAKADEVAGVADAAGNVTKLNYINPEVKRAADLVKTSVGTGEAVADNIVGRLETYKQIKNDISRMFKVPQSYINAKLIERGEDLSKDTARIEASSLTAKAREAVERYASKTGEDVDDITRGLTQFAEANMNRRFTNDEILKLAKEGKLIGYDEVIDTLNKIVDDDIPEELRGALDLSVSVNEKTGDVVLGKDWTSGKVDIKPMRETRFNKLEEKFSKAIAEGDEAAADKLAKLYANNTTTIGVHYTDEQLQNLQNLANKYVTDKDYQELVDNLLGTSWKRVNTSNEVLDNMFAQAKASGNTTSAKYGLINNINNKIDEVMGSKLGDKYDIFENTGYVPHTLTDEAASIKESYSNWASKKMTRGNASILGERTKLGSIDEINNYYKSVLDEADNMTLPADLLAFKKSNAKFMEDNYIKAITNRYLEPNGVTNVVKNTNMANKILVNEAFGNTDEIIKTQEALKNAKVIGDPIEIKDLTKKLNDLQENTGVKFLSDFDSKVPGGYKKVAKDDILGKLKKYQTMNSQIGLDSGINSLIKSIEGYSGQLAMDEDIINMFDIVSKKETYSGLGQLYNTWMNHFKKWKTASPTFLLNNLIGNSSNLALSGISPLDQARYGQTVLDIMQNGESYYLAKVAGQQLDAKSNYIANLWQMYRSMGFDQSALKLQELPEDFQKLFKGEKKIKNVKDVVTNGIPYINNMANIQMDKSARLMVMLKSIEDPGYISRLGVKDVREAIAKVMFDPDMLTSFERNTVKKWIPFYTYAKNNLIYHVTNMGQNGKKYNQLMKTMKGLRNLATDGKEENMSKFLKDNLYIPIPGLDKDGNYKVLRSSLPFGQVLEAASNPLDAGIGLLTPAVKTPFELLLNKDTFSGNDIESFPGQKSKNFPIMSKKMEKILSDLSGLDVPAKNIMRAYQGTADALKNQQNLVDSIGQGLQNTVTMSNNVNNDELYRIYDEIDQLQTIIKQYQQGGKNIPTITELRKANKNKTIEGIDAIFNKYGIK